MSGMATLGNGNDTLVSLRGNTKEALIDGGDGNDTFVVGGKAIHLHEASGMGYDTVKSTVSFVLDSNFEKLVLLGNKNINATGNSEANDLVGNAGSNNLKGLGGADELSGGRGADALTGGDDADLFIFAKGFGNDRVTDFENGLDRFDLKGWDEVKNIRRSQGAPSQRRQWRSHHQRWQ